MENQGVVTPDDASTWGKTIEKGFCIGFFSEPFCSGDRREFDKDIATPENCDRIRKTSFTRGTREV